MNAKPWQIALIVIGLVGGLGLIVYNLLIVNRGPTLADTMKVIDVTTGELFEVDLNGRGYAMPGRNPGTKKLALMPVVQDDAGAWYIPNRFLSSIGRVEGEVTAVDPQSGEVKVQVGKFKHLAHPSTWDEALKR